MQPDDEIISRALANDREAINELYCLTVKRIRPSLRAKFSGDLKEEIDDGIQNAFIKFLDKPPANIQSVNNVVAWMHTVVSNHVRDQIDKRKRLCSLESMNEQGHAIPISSFEETLTARHIKCELVDHLEKAMSNCSDEEKYLVQRYFSDHAKLKDIALEMNLPVTTIKKRKERLLAKLHQIFTNDGINSTVLQDAFTV